MKASARAIAAATAVAVPLPAHVPLILSGGMAALVLLVYIGIALPAVWSAKPTRRKAAADVLSRPLTPAPAGNANESQPQSLARRIRGQIISAGWHSAAGAPGLSR
jgi:hypothetical protein